MIRSACFLSITCLLLFAMSGLAQTQNAQLNGTITDPAGAVAPLASVTVTHLGTGVSRTILSNDTGNYVFTNLLPGVYTIAVSKEGFRKAVSKPITLDVNQTAMLNVQLQVGAVNESVQVTSQATLLEATTAQLGTVVTEEKIADLPLNGRNFTQLLILTAGATPVSVAQNSGGAQVQRVGTFVFPAINGQSNRSNSYTLDGVYNNGHYMGTYAIAPSVDALTQFKVQSHSDQAEFGGVSGGIVNIATKSGTNGLHGSLYEFLRNDALDARGFFTASKPPLRQNQFGGSVGGRVIKDKTFFFFSYEGYRQVNPSSALYLVPTPQELGGDFSASSRRLFDPYSTRTDPADPRRFLRDPFPNNIIPASKLNPATKAWADAVIPKPINTGFPRFNGRNTSAQTAPSDQYNIRVDHHFSSSDFLWARYTWGQEYQTSAQILQGTNNTLDRPAKNGGVNYTHIFGANTLFNALFGYSSLRESEVNFLTSKNLIKEGVFRGQPDHPAMTAPAISLTSAYGGLSSRIGDAGPMEGYQYRADLTHVAGGHTLKFGGEVVVEPWNRVLLSGDIGFSPLQTADLNNPGNTGLEVASFVLGVIDSRSSTVKDFALTSQLWNFYVQDSWKATPRLTVNWGMRWDLLRNPAFTRSYPSTWDFQHGKFIVGRTPPPACSDTQPAPCLQDPGSDYVKRYVTFTGDSKLNEDSYGMFGPRLGLAYRIQNKMVIRGSFGIFYDLQAGVTQIAQNGDSKWPSAGVVSAGNLNRNVVEFTAEAPYGNKNPRIPDPTPSAQTGTFYDPHFRNPYSEQWNIEIQREFLKNINVTAGYAGSHNLRLPIGGSYNTALTPGPGPITPRTLFPWAPVSDYDRSIGQSRYNAFLFKAEQRFAKGLSYLIAYTWSKSMDVASSGQFGAEGQSLQNPYDPNSSRSVSGFDIPHNLAGAIVYQLPFGHARRWIRSGVASRLLGNWQINTLLQLRSGQPFTPVMNIDSANIGALEAATRTRPDLVGNPGLSNPSPATWFDKTAFAAPKPFLFGTAGRNQLRTDGYNNVDFSLFREDSLTERFKIQLRAEAFNILNHTTFGTPQTTFTSPRFGEVSGTVSRARQIQLGLKLLF